MTPYNDSRLPANNFSGLENLNGAIITDCYDDNARLRQEINFKNLFGTLPTFRGLADSYPDFQAACNLIDLLGAWAPVGTYPNSPLVVLVNVAPRGDEVKKKHENGTPFGYVKVGNAHIFSTVEGRALSLIKKFGLADEIEEFDIPTVAEYLVSNGTVSEVEATHLVQTQFRSMVTLPKIAYEVVTGSQLPSVKRPIEIDNDVSGRAYEIDNFGNIKIAATPEDINFQAGGTAQLANLGTVRCIDRLTNVPEDGDLALIVGSSGLAHGRFLELVIQKGSATQKLTQLIGQPPHIGQRIIEIM